MSDPSDEKIELLVRSVLAAVDARLVEVRSEIDAVASDAERRHRDVLSHMQALEHRWESRVAETGQTAVGGDSLAARMEQATQVLLERIEAMHQRNTMATNERFALINHTLEQLNGGVLVPSAISVPIASLDGMNAPLRVGPPTGQVPVAPLVPVTEPALSTPMPMATQMPAAVPLPPIPPITTAPPREPRDEASEPIDMNRLADLLSERLDSLNLPPHQQHN